MRSTSTVRQQELLRPVPDTRAEPIDAAPRWEIGIDRKRVGVYVTLALIAGVAIGYAISRYALKTERATAPVRAESELPARASAVESPANEFHRVTRVLRADTIEVEGVGPVRMIGIETPDGKLPVEIYGVHGQQALGFVQRSLTGQDVRLEFDSPEAVRDKDEAGLTPAYVFTRDGIMFNGELVRLGHAFVRAENAVRFADDLRGLERDAMRAMRGVWGMDPASVKTSEQGEKARKLTPLLPSDLGPSIPGSLGSASAPEQLVFVSASDRMYHKSGCEYLGKKNRVVPISLARSEGYTGCGRCFASTLLKAP
ncbi:MAG TPA: thermonuclease family protein [Blastocatellia bacterium]|nr:thermonuclease family protein [Blastocatellia bacterium]